MLKNLLSTVGLCLIVGISQAQPPGFTGAICAGCTWSAASPTATFNDPAQKTGGSTATTGVASGCAGNPTTSCGMNDTSIGWATQCATVPNTVVGTPGCNMLQSQLFGTGGGDCNAIEGVAPRQNPGMAGCGTAGSMWPNRTVETRKTTHNQWTNPNNTLAAANGAGTRPPGYVVTVPTRACVNFRNDGIGDGTGPGGDEARGVIIGGNGPGNRSKFKGTFTWDMDISAGGSYMSTALNLPDVAVGSATGVFMGEETGGASGRRIEGTAANEHNNDGWRTDNNGGAFGTINHNGGAGQGYTNTVCITTGIGEAGGTFDINFTSAFTTAIERIYGNADGRFTMGPGMGGKAEYFVEYQTYTLNGPNPVTWADFRGRLQDNGSVNISWATSSEINSDRFEVQRSADATTFETLGAVKAAGNTNDRKGYEFADAAPLAGVNYYRLKQVDTDGKFEFSRVISVNTNAKAEVTLTVFPNPSTEKVQVRLSGGEQIQAIRVRTAQGVLMADLPVSENSISMEEMIPGIYFVEVETDTRTVRQRVVKQ